jgi:hypothetical protein
MKQPWISLSRREGVAFRIDNSVIDNLIPVSDQHYFRPDIALFIGKREKNQILRSLEIEDAYDNHGDVHISQHPISKTLILDGEIHNHMNDHWQLPSPNTGPGGFFKVGWMAPNTFTSRDLGAMIYTRVLLPFVNTICIFAKDFGGIPGAAQFLAKMAESYIPHDLSDSIKPQVLLIVNTESTHPNIEKAQSKFLSNYQSCIRDIEFHREIFQDISILLLHQDAHIHQRKSLIESTLLQLNLDRAEFRQRQYTRFNLFHMKTLTSLLLEHLCERDTPFSFIDQTRPVGFTTKDHSYHVETLLSMIPSDIWLCHLVVPLIASALILSTYPPGSHGKS